MSIINIEGMVEKRVIRIGTTRQQLANYYNCDVDTIIQWLREIGVTHQKNLKPIELARFIESVGSPDIDTQLHIPYLKVESMMCWPNHSDAH